MPSLHFREYKENEFIYFFVCVYRGVCLDSCAKCVPGWTGVRVKEEMFSETMNRWMRAPS